MAFRDALVHGGRIRAEREGDGKGATFTVVLPSSAFDRRQTPSTRSDARAADTSQPTDSLEGIRLLIVEDEPDTRDYLERFLKSFGAEVICARSADEAITQSAIPAIALTAYARTEDRTRAFRAGYQAHLSKPVEPAELVATIASFADLIEAQRKKR